MCSSPPFYEDRGQVRLAHRLRSARAIFKKYSAPIFNIDGMEDGWIGPLFAGCAGRSASNMSWTFNSWGDKPGKPNFFVL